MVNLATLKEGSLWKATILKMDLDEFIHVCLLNLKTANLKCEKHLLCVKNQDDLISEVLEYEATYRPTGKSFRESNECKGVLRGRWDSKML